MLGRWRLRLRFPWSGSSSGRTGIDPTTPGKKDEGQPPAPARQPVRTEAPRPVPELRLPGAPPAPMAAEPVAADAVATEVAAAVVEPADETPDVGAASATELFALRMQSEMAPVTDELLADVTEIDTGEPARTSPLQLPLPEDDDLDEDEQDVLLAAVSDAPASGNVDLPPPGEVPLPPPRPQRQPCACPNCGGTLDGKPMARTSCPHCDETIHVRARQKLFRSGLVADRDIGAIDFFESVEAFGISESSCRERLEAGGRDTRLSDVVWSLCEERVAELPEAQRGRLLNEMAMQSRWLGAGDRFLALRRQAEISGLMNLRQGGVTEVKVVTREGACTTCEAGAGQILGIEEALAAPLPVAACQRHEGLCRCAYSAARRPS